MNNVSYTKLTNNRKTYTIDIPSIALCAIVCMSFMLHFIVNVFSGVVYSVLIFMFTVIYVISKPMFKRRMDWLTLSWLVSVFVIWFNYLRYRISTGAFLDVIVFSCSAALIYFCSRDEKQYIHCMSLIKAFAVFFAIGVLLQVFLPKVYSIVLSIFPSEFSAKILSENGSGFTTNTGFSAGYIIAGILTFVSEIDSIKGIKLKNGLFLLFLLLALFLTGKRGPAIFLILTVFFCYLVPVKGKKKMKRYWNIFLFVFVTIIFFLAFQDAFARIPFIAKIINTIEGIVAGKDVTSSRLGLYAWALKLFKNNPLFGIGWGGFRTTVAGNVTLATELETHNIFLQLLCETGLVGFLSFCITFLLFWNTTKNAYCKCVQQEIGKASIWRRVLFFSFAYQTYFLLYGLTGNPLYDQHFQIIYILSCSISVAYSIIRRYEPRS